MAGKKLKIILKLIFALFLSSLFLLLTRFKFSQILGTKMNFSLAVFIGPTLTKIFGSYFGTLIIILSQILGITLGILKLESIKDIFVFFPIIFSGIFFAKIIKKEKTISVLPLLCILFFLMHPIGFKVWFYSLFWIIPLILTFFDFPKYRLFGKSLATAFVDHAVGSTIYLYLLNIPARFWIQAIPLTILERIFISFGILIFYLLEVQILKIFLKVPIFLKMKKLIFA